MTANGSAAMERRQRTGVAARKIRGSIPMRRTLTVLAATALGALALVSCDDYSPRSEDADVETMTIEEPVAPSAEDSAAPVVAPDVEDSTPTPPPETLPPEERSSEQTVQPESETLFY